MKEAIRTPFVLIVLTFFLFNFLLVKQGAAQKYPIETVVQTGHNTQVADICFSDNGKYILSVGGKKAILWDIATGRQIRTYSGVNHCISRCIFLEDNNFIGLSCKTYDQDLINKTMVYTIFNIETGELIERRKMPYHWINDIDNGKMRITRKGVVEVKNEAYNLTMYFLQEKSRRDSTRFELNLITTDSNRLVQVFKGHSAYSNSSCFSSDEKYFFSGGGDGLAFYWDVKTGKVIYEFDDSKSAVTAVCLSKDGKQAATANTLGQIMIYNLQTGERTKLLRTETQGVGEVAYNSKYKMILASSLIPKVWNLKTLTIDQVLDFSRDMKEDSNLIYRGENVRPLKVYGKRRKVSSFVDRNFFDAKYSPNNELIATASFSNKLNLWDAQTGEKLDSVKLFKRTIFGLSFSPDGQFIAAGSNDSKIKVYDLVNKKVVAEITNNRECVYSIAYSPDGSKIAFVKDGYSDLKIIDTKTYKIATIIKFRSRMLLSVDYSSDGRYIIASGTDTRPVAYDTEKKKTISFPVEHMHGIKAVKFYHGSDYFFSAGYDNIIKQWDFKKREAIKTFKGHDGSVNSIDFIKDKNLLISGSDDGTTKIWNIDSGKLLLTLIAKSGSEYIAFTPDNYYFSTKSAMRGMHFVQGMKTYGFEQFDLKYNRPDIVLSRLGFSDSTLIEAYHKAYLKRLKKMNFTEDMLKDDIHLPEIEIENFEEFPAVTNDAQLNLKLKLMDSKYKLDRINVWINNVAVYGTNGISLRDQGVSSYQLDLKLNLVKGINKVQVSVLNQAGAESYKAAFDIECKAGKAKPNLYLITIGESKFRDENYNLTYAAKDAQDVASLFAGSNIYQKVIVKTLTNEQVTKENIEALRNFLDQADINDEVIIFIAGHGVLDENLDYFFASYDMDFNNPNQRGIAYEDLEGLLDGIKPLKKVLLIDACHSGEIDKEEVELLATAEVQEGEVQFRAVGNSVKPKLGMQNTSELTKQLFTDLRKGTGATVISSAGGGEYAMESGEWKNGLFTYCMIKGIKTKAADLNGDGEIWLKELQEYVQTQVKELSRGKQQPTSRIENNVLDYRVW